MACSTEVTQGSATETRATCCPQATGLGALSVSSFGCQVNSLFFATSYGCVLGLGDLASNSLTVIATNSSTFLSTFSVGPLDGVNAFSVQIRWQESDLRTTADQTTSTISPAGSTSNSRSTATSAVVPSTSGSATTAAATSVGASQSTSSSSSSGGLSTGAIIAIAVVIPIVVIAALVAGFFVMRRKKRVQSAQPASHSVIQSEPKHELPAGGSGYMYIPPSELDGVPRYETGSDTKEAIMKE